jgi:hypothetical protein
MTMHPGNIRKSYSDYLEGRLDEAARHEFETILDENPELRDDYDLFVKAHRLVTGVAPEPAEPGFESKVLSRLAAGRERRAAPLFPFRLMATGALAAAVAFAFTAIVVVYVNRGGEPIALPGPEPAASVTAEPETMAREETVPLAEHELFADPEVASQVDEIATLIDEINKLSEQFRRQEDEVLLHASQDKGLVLRPSNLYRKASLAGTRGSRQGDEVVHAY